MRKILPALYAAHRDGMLAPNGRIVAVARRRWIGAAICNGSTSTSSRTYRRTASTKRHGELSRAHRRTSTLDARQARRLRAAARRARRDCPACASSIWRPGPSLFVPICRALASVGLTENARIVLEKPLGYDLEVVECDQRRGRRDLRGRADLPDRPLPRQGTGAEPARAALRQCAVRAAVAPRMGREHPDHDCGRTRRRRRAATSTTTPARCATWCRTTCCNCCPSSRWSRRIRWMRIRCATKSCACCARSSRSLGDEIRQSRGARPVSCRRHQRHVGAGLSRPNPACRPDSTTETFVALKVEIENWRWAGVPFFLRTGKRLADRVAEIVVNFRPVPHSALGAIGLAPGFEPADDPSAAERIDSSLAALAKQPGEGMNLAGRAPRSRVRSILPAKDRMEAYQRLLLDVIAGRLALFVRRDEQEAAWRWVEPILDDWATQDTPPKPYARARGDRPRRARCSRGTTRAGSKKRTERRPDDVWLTIARTCPSHNKGSWRAYP